MATFTLDGVGDLLKNLNLEEGNQGIPSFTGADVQSNPLDIYQAHLADILVHLTSCEPQSAYDSILLPSPNEFGDLRVVLPRLRLHDIDPEGLAADLRQKVRAVSQ